MSFITDPTLRGRIIGAGNLFDNNGDDFTGLLIEVVVTVDCGNGAQMTIPNAANHDTHIEWQQRYASVTQLEKNRFVVASMLESYDYLLSGAITEAEAIKRLKQMRKARKETLSLPNDTAQAIPRLSDSQ